MFSFLKKKQPLGLPPASGWKPETSQIPPSEPPERVHALDAVRALALLLGVFFHSTMSFLPGPQLWVVRDIESGAISVIFYVSHVFRMTVYFLIAGYFGRLLLHRVGTRGFIRNRAQRITLPFLVFWPLILAGMAGAFFWASSRTGVTLAELARLQRAPGPRAAGINAVPLTHLWFLYLLSLFYLATLTLRWAASRLDRDGRFRANVLDRGMRLILATPASILFLAAPVAAALARRPNWQGWIGIQAPAIGLIPNAGALIGFATAFAFGWLLQRQRALLPAIQQWWLVYSAVAVLLTALCLAHDGLRPILIPRPGTGAGPLYAACYALAAWAWALGLIGAAQSWWSVERPAVRYVANASYWIYIVHLPVVMAFQVLVWPLPFPVLVKYLLVVTGALLLVLASYDLLVRNTWLGGWLNGKRYPRAFMGAPQVRR